MITLGIDLASQAKATAAAKIEWKGGRAIAGAPALGCIDARLDQLIGEANLIGIDAPFGWPIPFVDAVNQWTDIQWTDDLRDRLRFRETDRFVRQITGLNPLSVSTDRISLPAMRAMALLRRHNVTNRSGDGRLFEVYPAASLKAWSLPCKGYKMPLEPDCLATRRAILEGLRGAMPWLEVPDEYADNSDALDALVAALTVRAAGLGTTHLPDPGLVPIASQEGWIHIPTQFPTS